ncbi:hypothetical protein C8R47DRAFT_1170048 [Mycena vitilis]|nr:hypothetical protein C8R47DRAFT_1170048 [Mycena vitilis]
MSDSYPLIIAQYNLVGHARRTEHWSLAALVDKRQAFVMQVIGNSDSFSYQPKLAKSFAASRSLRGGFLVGRIPADKADDLQNMLREVPVIRYDKRWDCQTWVMDALRYLKDSSRAEWIEWAMTGIDETSIREELARERARWEDSDDTLEERLFP